MVPWQLIGSALVRLFSAVLPRIGVLNNNFQDFALRDEELKEAKELFGFQQSRLILLSWPPLSIVAILNRAEQLDLAIAPFSAFVLFSAGVVLCCLVLLIKPVQFRRFLPSFPVFVVVTVADVALQFFVLGAIVGLLKK